MHRLELRPLFGDVDVMNIVYYGNYLKFFEQGRAELMRDAGRPYAELADNGLHLPVTEAYLRYRKGARYDELIEVQTTVAWIKKASLRFDYKIVSNSNPSGGIELVTGYTTHACVDLDGKVKPLPAWVVEGLRQHLEPGT
jgi:acyl-CoA thioester hydrolase